jgi:hypothetical protein
MFFGKERRSLSWRLALLVTLIAAGTALAVVMLTAGEGAEPAGAASPLPGQADEVVATNLASVVPAAAWADCHLQAVANPGADETAACVPAKGVPDRWEVSRTESASCRGLPSAPGNRVDIQQSSGRCNARVGGENAEPRPGRPAGRFFRYLMVTTPSSCGRTSVATSRLTWTSPSRPARGKRTRGPTRWWGPPHHVIGKPVSAGVGALARLSVAAGGVRARRRGPARGGRDRTAARLPRPRVSGARGLAAPRRRARARRRRLVHGPGLR